MNAEEDETPRIERWFGRFVGLVADFARARSATKRSGVSSGSECCSNNREFDSTIAGYDDDPFDDDNIRRSNN